MGRRAGPRRPARLRLLLAIPLACFAIAGCAAPAPSALPGPDLTPVPAPSVALATRAPAVPLEEEWRGKTIQDAIGALRSVDSFRFVVADTDERMSGTVINGDPARTHSDRAPRGSLPMSTIVIGDDAWTSTAGGAWVHELRDGISEDGIPEEYGHAFFAALPDDLGGMFGWEEDAWGGPMDGLWFYPAFEDVGVEDRNGVETRHVRAIGDGTLTQPDDGSTISGAAFLGTFDAWIAVDGDYLVALRIDGRRVPEGGAQVDETPDPFDTDREFTDIQITGMNDPANVIEAPENPPATPLPSGDPGVADLLEAAMAATEDLRDYRLTAVSTQGGETMESVMTVLGGPPLRAHSRAEAGWMWPASELLILGDDAWTRIAGESWVEPNPTTYGCPANGTETLGACLAKGFGPAAMRPESALETYVRVPGEETIDGIAVTHYRSTAGLDLFDSVAPGTSDVWIAVDGGWIVRSRFVGQGIEFMDDVRVADERDLPHDLPTP